jgi:enolase-phosphatase E1
VRGALDAIVLDIEGTTTPIAFVYDVLFPFARRHLRAFLRDVKRGGDAAAADAIVRLELEWADDVAKGNAPPPWHPADAASPDGAVRDADLSLVAAYLEWLMDRDRKSPALKSIQGLIWQRGYQSGELTSEIFEDVGPALERWRRAGLRLAIYSSGSVLAQRLLFGHTPAGDLTPFFAGFFDTAVGPKTSADSYRAIAAALGCAAERVLFVSDVARELDAARDAGCRTTLAVRPGNPPQASFRGGDVVRTFNEIAVS